MPLFLHVHDAPGVSFEEVRQAHLRDASLARDHGVDYRRFWADADGRRFFCLVEAPTAEAAEDVHAAGHGMLPTETYRVREGLRDRKDYESMRILFAGALAPDSNCIDVGCHHGIILREMVRCAPEGRHIAFEPIPDLCQKLVTRFPRVDVRQAALSSESGERTFAHLPERPGYSHLVPDAETVEEPAAELITVRVEPLDRALPDGYAPSLVKIDVEGAELEVLRGAVETLARFRPIVIFEHGFDRREDSDEIFDLLSGRTGLRIYDIDGNGPMRHQHFIDVLGEMAVWNFVARP